MGSLFNIGITLKNHNKAGLTSYNGDIRLFSNLDAEVAEFGRRAGFRIQWAKARGGSNPPFGTMDIQW
jgi:hypothetical protein